MKKLLSCVLPVLLLLSTSFQAEPTESKFSATSTMEREVRLVVQLLEHAHYSKKTISELDFDDLLTRYMADLDHARLFYTKEDHREILDRFGPKIEFSLFQGRMEPAFEIFSLYKARLLDRLDWVLARIEEDFDLNSDQVYLPDRREADWPADPAAAHELWEQRLKHEVLQLVLNQEQIRKILAGIEEEYAETADTVEELNDEAVREVLERVFEEHGETTIIDRIVERAEQDGLRLSEMDLEEIKGLVTDEIEARDMEEGIDRIAQRYERMQQRVSDMEAVEIQEVFLSTLTRMFDPHSTFLSADTLEDFAISMRLSLVGIGAILTNEDGYCVIRELVPGGPADLSNRIQPEDRIIAVAQEDEDPVDVVDMSLRRVVNMIRGEQGTRVTLTIIPAEAPDPSVRKEVTLVRDEIKLTASQARGKIYEVPGKNDDFRSLGVIEIPSFYGGGDSNGTTASTTEDVKELIGKMTEIGIDGLAIDLRRNGGGLLNEAVNLTGLFIDSGPVVKIRDSSGNIRVDPIKNSGITYDGPLGILVSRNSASASEIVAGALQSYKRAVVIGEESTHGKGTVQAIFELGNYLRTRQAPDLRIGATKLTVQKFYLPDGKSTQNQGVVPDVVIPSFTDYLPIGESSLPNALEWDTIDDSGWEDYQEQAAVSFPIERESVTRIVEASRNRQDTLEEFQYWYDNLEWFRDRQAQAAVSLNLEQRQRQRELDTAFRARMNEIEDRIAREDGFSYREVNLDTVENDEPAYPPEPDLQSTYELNGADGEEADRERLDIHLRETLRVLGDLVMVQKERKAVAVR